MRYVVVDPIERIVRAHDVDSYLTALDRAGLEKSRVDHGQVEPGVAIVVHEHALFIPVTEQRYFGIKGRLYGGKALLYAYDTLGDTIDLKRVPDVKFYVDAKAVEIAIMAGTIQRPRNSDYNWQWPEPPPPELYP
jgi:hypothetical protein